MRRGLSRVCTVRSISTPHEWRFYHAGARESRRTAGALRARGRNARRQAVALAALCAAACSAGNFEDEYSASNGLVFIRVVDGSPDVARVRISDGAIRAVTTTPERPERWPHWSDAAQRLVYQTGRPDDRRASDLVLWDPISERETELVTTPHREERWPAWSPDGRRLIFAFHGGKPAAGIASADWQNGKVGLIAESGVRDFFLRPSFSPDGRQLVTQRRSKVPGSSQLWVLAAGAAPRRLTVEPEWIDTKPEFTRDGKRIVYTRRGAEEDSRDVVSIRAAGGDLRPVIATPADEHSARPSPTRDEVVFLSSQDGSSDVFLVNLSGKGLRRLRRTPEWNEFAPRWSPDGERVVVMVVPRDIDGSGMMRSGVLARSARLVVLDRDGKTLLETPGSMADWMPPWP
jgi:Tol biopolymer transport system component